jgi:predicted TIM-barrel fold metal-dependent hydrolase
MSTRSGVVPQIPRIISVDDHVIEPPDVWSTRLPKRFLEEGPRVERRHIREDFSYTGGRYNIIYQDTGIPCDCWVYGDLVVPHKRIVAAAGLPREDITMTVITYDDMPAGCYDQTARLKAMDENWTEASLSFPTFPRFCGQTFLEAKNRELAMLCVRAYNDWMIEEWCAGSEGRLIPLPIVPLWDANAAAGEVRRNAARGARAVCFSEIPPYLGLPSVHDPDGFWDPFFIACEETSTVVCMHIGSSSVMPATSADAPAAVQASLTFNNAMGSMSDFIFSGVLARYPRLKLAYSEGQIGWIPYLLERMDNVWLEHRGWGGVADSVPEPPSTYYYRQIYGCFFDDQHGLDSLDRCGVDNVTFEVDYPHSDSTWPNSKKVAERIMTGLPQDVVHKLVRGNAITMLGLDFE